MTFGKQANIFKNFFIIGHFYTLLFIRMRNLITKFIWVDKEDSFILRNICVSYCYRVVVYIITSYVESPSNSIKSYNNNSISPNLLKFGIYSINLTFNSFSGYFNRKCKSFILWYLGPVFSYFGEWVK